MRSPLSVTFAVWHAIFLREALDRLFDMRFAWFWLLAEPAMHIGFMSFIRIVIRVRVIGNADALVWIIVGMLAFFLFRRTAVQVMHAADSNKSFFAYRQVKAFDPTMARAVLEGVLMAIVSAIILATVSLLGRNSIPWNPLWLMQAVLGLWLFGIGFGMVAAVLIELVPEMKHVINILMMPLYLISGVIIPLASIPQPYQKYLMINPIAHGLELARQGFFPYYHTVSGLSMTYLYLWAVISFFLGLLLFRRFEQRLVMR